MIHWRRQAGGDRVGVGTEAHSNEPAAGAHNPASATDQATASRAAFDHGVRLVREGSLPEAAAAFRRADQLGHPKAACNLGVTLLELGNVSGAEDAFRRADRSGDAHGAFNLGLLLLKRDQAAAEAAFRRADERGLAAGARQVGLMLRDRGETAAAIAALQRADARGDAEGAFILGSLLVSGSDSGAAQVAFRHADERGHASAACNLGVLLAREGDVDGARAAFRRSAERGDASGAHNLGLLLRRQGDAAGAVAALRRAAEIGESSAVAAQSGEPDQPEAPSRADATGESSVVAAPPGEPDQTESLPLRGDVPGAAGDERKRPPWSLLGKIGTGWAFSRSGRWFGMDRQRGRKDGKRLDARDRKLWALGVIAILAVLLAVSLLTRPSGSRPSAIQTSTSVSVQASAVAAPVPTNRVTGKGTAAVQLHGDVLTVELRTTGLLNGSPHLAHIHGLGEGRCPTASAARLHNGHLSISTGDAIRLYGPTLVSFTEWGSTSGAVPTNIDMNRYPATGNINYSRTMRVSRLVADLIRDGNAVIVVHGIDYNQNGIYDFGALGVSDLDQTLPGEATAPALCGALHPSSNGQSSTTAQRDHGSPVTTYVASLTPEVDPSSGKAQNRYSFLCHVAPADGSSDRIAPAPS